MATLKKLAELLHDHARAEDLLRATFASHDAELRVVDENIRAERHVRVELASLVEGRDPELACLLRENAREEPEGSERRNEVRAIVGLLDGFEPVKHDAAFMRKVEALDSLTFEERWAVLQRLDERRNQVLAMTPSKRRELLRDLQRKYGGGG